METKASMIFGALGGLFVAGTISEHDLVRLLIFAALAALFGLLAARSYYRESISAFEDRLADFAPKLTRIRRDWRRKARLAAWPAPLRYSKGLRLSEWAAAHIGHLQPAQLDVLEIARELYADDAFLDDPAHKKARRSMRQIADLWSQWGRRLLLLSCLRDSFYGNVLKPNREALIMLAYVEIALAEKLARDGASPGVVGPWAALGEQHASFCQVPITTEATHHG
jgi:hypothetical protein